MRRRSGGILYAPVKCRPLNHVTLSPAMNLPRVCRRMMACLALLALHAFAALPLDQRPAKPDEWGYRPADGATVALNPPTFTWIAPANAVTYDVQFSTNRDFSANAASTVTVEQIVWPTYTHSAAVKPG